MGRVTSISSVYPPRSSLRQKKASPNSYDLERFVFLGAAYQNRSLSSSPRHHGKERARLVAAVCRTSYVNASFLVPPTMHRFSISAGRSHRKAALSGDRDFEVRYRKQRERRWKRSSVETYDIYMRNRLMPYFGRLRLDAIHHTGVSVWFDAASAEKPGTANRAYVTLRVMINTARQWG